jgi:bifunctional ADP-heptose synthase (sugar kinase/adenylyltransferase)
LRWSETYKPGGAGNAAANLATLSGRRPFGVVGDDAAELFDAVKPFGVRCGIVTGATPS